MVGFVYESISRTRCMTIHRCSVDDLDKKLDIIITMLGNGNKTLWKGFGLDILANIVGNAIDGQ